MDIFANIVAVAVLLGVGYTFVRWYVTDDSSFNSEWSN